MPAITYRRFALHRCTAAILMALVTPVAVHAQATAETQNAPASQATAYAFDIPAQPLGNALQAFARASRQQVSFNAAAVEGKTSAALSGRYSADEAIRRLLDGTGVSFRRGSQGVWLVGPPQPAQPTTYDFDIPSQDLARALRAFTRVTGQQVEFDNAHVRGKVSILLEGNYTADGGLQAMLRDTNLAVRGDAGGVLRLEERSRQEMAQRAAGDATELETIVVTGTNIRGVGPVGANVITINQREIDQSGFATVPQLLESLPQNFSGEGEDSLSGQRTPITRSFATTVDLRGLGADSTLTLLNGRRLAPTGAGQAVDVSIIPIAAIERVEILTDGASAIYGSDAIAGVVNFILKTDFEGADTRLRIGSATGGDGDEIQASQLLGTSWRTGSALLSYEYYRRDSILISDREYYSNWDKRKFGGTDRRSSSCFPGNVVAGGVTYGIPANQNGQNLPQSSLLAGQVNRCSPIDGVTLLPNQVRHSVFGHISQDIGQQVNLYADILFSDRQAQATQAQPALTLTVPTTNYYRTLNNLFPNLGPIQVLYNPSGDLGPRQIPARTTTTTASAGLEFNLPSDWSADLGFSYGRNRDETTQTNILNSAALLGALASDNPATAFNPFAGIPSNSPTVLAPLLTTGGATRASFDVLSAQLLANGPLLSLPGGDARFAFGGGARQENYQPTSDSVYPRSSRDVQMAFAELNVPIVGPQNARPGIQSLVLSAAGRYERYSDFGETFNERIGAQWSPIRDLVLRASYGSSFKAPLLLELYAPTLLTSTNIPAGFDPQSTGTVPFVQKSGGNPSLRPETSRSWTAGFDYKPSQLRRAQLGFTYFDINIHDRVNAAAQNLLLIFANEEGLTRAGLFIRNPSQAQIDALASNSDRVNLFGPPLVAGSVAILMDARSANLDSLRLRGFDVNAGFGVDTCFGNFDFNVNASYLLDYLEKAAGAVQAVDQASTVAYPVDLRLRGTGSFSRGAFSSQIALNYSDNYRNALPNVARTDVSSWATVDMGLSYDFGRSKLLPVRGLSASFFVRNVFDQDPPFVDVIAGYDAANADPVGRTVALTLRQGW